MAVFGGKSGWRGGRFKYHENRESHIFPRDWLLLQQLPLLRRREKLIAERKLQHSAVAQQQHSGEKQFIRNHNSLLPLYTML